MQHDSPSILLSWCQKFRQKLKMVQDRRIVSIRVEEEVVCALSSSYIGNDLDDPQATPVSTFCITFRIFIVGEWRDLKFGTHIDYN